MSAIEGMGCLLVILWSSLYDDFVSVFFSSFHSSEFIVIWSMGRLESRMKVEQEYSSRQIACKEIGNKDRERCDAPSTIGIGDRYNFRNLSKQCPSR